MSNVIGFLETLGSRPALSPADYANAVALLDADEAQREALLASNATALNDLLGGREKMVCMVWQPPEEPVRKDDDEDEPGEPGQAPDPDQPPQVP